MANKVFVSYARPDVEYAMKLTKELRNIGLEFGGFLPKPPKNSVGRFSLTPLLI